MLLEDRAIVLAVDGGITKTNAAHVASLGVDMIVVGSAVYDGGSPTDNARSILRMIQGVGGRVDGR